MRHSLWTGRAASILVAIGIAVPASVQGQCAVHDGVRLDVPDPLVLSSYGRAVAASDDLIVIGARGATIASPDGVVHVYRLQSGQWVEEAQLVPPAGGGPRFGHAVAVNGDAIVVGAPPASNGAVTSGAAYVYRFDGFNWAWEATLTASNGAADDLFGDAVSIDGEVIVVGASGKDGSGTDSGSAYIYRFDGLGWTQEIELRASDAGERHLFGSAVSISGDVAVVGAWNHDNTGQMLGDGHGAVYLFRFDGGVWSEEANLRSADPIPGERDRYGQSVSLDGDVLLVGTRPFPTTGLVPSFGAAYVYQDRGGRWIVEAKLTAHDASRGDRFGFSVSVKGDVAVIGAPWARMGASCPWPRSCRDGAAYLFEYDGAGWRERAKLRSSDLGEDDYFATAVAATETFVIAGAFGNDTLGPETGAAYVFGVTGVCCYADCDVSTGVGALDVFDFLCFQSSFVGGETYACDCDTSTGNGVCDVFDFLCFQNAFVAGCP